MVQESPAGGHGRLPVSPPVKLRRTEFETITPSSLLGVSRGRSDGLARPHVGPKRIMVRFIFSDWLRSKPETKFLSRRFWPAQAGNDVFKCTGPNCFRKSSGARGRGKVTNFPLRIRASPGTETGPRVCRRTEGRKFGLEAMPSAAEGAPVPPYPLWLKCDRRSQQ